MKHFEPLSLILAFLLFLGACGQPKLPEDLPPENAPYESNEIDTKLIEAFSGSGLYEEGKELYENMALLSAVGSTKIVKVQLGGSMFTDNAFSFGGKPLPSGLLGKSYLYDKMSGASGKVEKAGYVIVTAPSANYASVISSLEKSGFVKLLAKQPVLGALAATIKKLDSETDYYVKWCEEGESIGFPAWSIIFFDTLPSEEDYYVFPWLTETPMFVTDVEKYGTATRQWQGVTSLGLSPGGRLFATWVAGGNGEPRVGNYDVIEYSDDDGKTWAPLFYIMFEPDSLCRVNDVQFWTDPDGVLWLFYIQDKNGSDGFTKQSGAWCVTISNPDAPVSEFEISKPRRLFDGLLRNSPIVLSDGTWLAAPNHYIDEDQTVVYASADKGQTWEVRGFAYAPDAYNFDETMIVEKTDGTLWMMIRSKSKFILESFSSDKGYTWTDAKNSSFPDPSARFYFGRLSSGNLIMISHATSASRTRMTGYISKDEGKTWSSGLLIFEATCSYPDLKQAADGSLYIIFDNNRLSTSARILICKTTEEEILKGGRFDTGRLIIVSSLK